MAGATGGVTRAALFDVIRRHGLQIHEDDWYRLGATQAPGDRMICARAAHAVRFAVNAGVRIGCFEPAIIRWRDLVDNPPESIGV